MKVELLSKVRAAVLGAFVVAVLPAAQDAHAYTLKTLYTFCNPSSCNDGFSFVYYGPILGANGHLYGLTYGAGANGTGMAYELTPNHDGSWSFKDIYDFGGGPNLSYWPMSALIQDAGENLYGTLSSSSTNSGSGAVFKLSKKGKSWKLTTLYQFCQKADCTDGRSPYGPLTYAGAQSGLPYDGTSQLYGAASRGGTGFAVVYALTPKGKKWREQVVSVLQDDNFSNQGTVLAGADGTLYGATAGGFGSAKAFALIPNAKKTKWKRKDLHDLDTEPNGDLINDATGALLGTDQGGGAHSAGFVYRLDPKTKAYQSLYDFCALSNCTDGKYAAGGVKMDAAGDLFGITGAGGGHNIDESGQGGGTVYRLHNGTLQTLYAFCAVSNCTDGEYPVSRPELDADGNIFGAASFGGANGGGTVFELMP